MKPVRLLLLGLGLVGFLVGSVGAGAQGRHDFGVQGFAPSRPPIEKMLGAEGRWWNRPKMVADLKLTDDQRKAMDQIFYNHRAKLIDLVANLERAELAMQPLMSADQPDQKAMEAQINKIVAARGDLERANSLFLLDIRMKLTPDQWKLVQERHAGGMRGPGPGAGPMQRWRNGNGGPGAPPAGAAPQQGAAPQAETPDGPPPAGPAPASGNEQ